MSVTLATSVDLVALVLEEPLEQREDDERAARCRRGCGRRPSARRRRCRRGPGRAGASGTTWPVRVSCRRIVAHGRDLRPRASGRSRRIGRDACSRCACRATCVGRELATPSASRLDEAFRTLPDALPRAPSPASTPPTTSAWATSGHTWEVRCTTHGARVAQGRHAPAQPDVVDRHRRRDLAAPARGRAVRRRGVLAAPALRPRRPRPRGRLRGPVPPAQRPPAAAAHPRRARRARSRVSTLTMGEGPDVLLLHGLGGTKSVVLRHRGGAQRPLPRPRARPARASAAPRKPATGALRRAAASPAAVLGLMDALGIERAHLVGNSMGGRVAIEVGADARPSASAALGAAVPGGGLRQARLSPARAPAAARARAAARTRFGRGRVERQFWALFADRDLVDPSVADVVVDEFQRIYRSAGARLAFLAAARNIYLDAPFGRGGFYPRLAELEPPALFVWGSHDRLIPPGVPPPRRALAARAPSRSSSRAAATCRRSSARSRPTGCCGASSPTSTRWARRGGRCGGRRSTAAARARARDRWARSGRANAGHWRAR